jgi:hypothetical protein
LTSSDSPDEDVSRDSPDEDASQDSQDEEASHDSPDDDVSCDLTGEAESEKGHVPKALPLPRLPPRPMKRKKAAWPFQAYAKNEYMSRRWIGLDPRILQDEDVTIFPDHTTVSVAYVCEVDFREPMKGESSQSNAIETLRDPKGWLTDDVVNACMGLMNNRQERPDSDERTPRCIFQSSLWYANLFNKDGTCNLKYAKNMDLAQADLLILPVNVDKAHWVLMVADMGAKEITVYNSQESEFTEPQKTLEFFLKLVGEHRDLKFLRGTWENYCITPPAIPKQKDGYNCGLFTIAAADCIAMGRRPSGYSVSDMPKMRKGLLHLLGFPNSPK